MRENCWERDKNGKIIMDEQQKQNLNQINIRDFILFLFDHEAIPEGLQTEDYKSWYYNVEVIFNPCEILNHYTHLFENPEIIAGYFTDDQLEQGFSALLSSTIDCSMPELIWDSRIQISDRIQCIKSNFNLFDFFFSKYWFGSISHMWWDPITYGFHCGNLPRKNQKDDIQLQNIIFETLQKILMIDSDDCRASALHGMGHLHHKDTEAIIRDFLKRHQDIDDELKRYALSAMQFKVL
jgi:hypothetical protein